MADLSPDKAANAHSVLHSAEGCKADVLVQDIDLGEPDLPQKVKLSNGEYDIVLAAAVLHHLRTDTEWRDVFAAFYRALRPVGSAWVFDLVESSIPAVGRLMRQNYGEYLTGLKDEAYRDHVFAYVEKEDTPRPLLFQLDLLRQVGFSQVDVLHKNVCFAAFGAVKG